MAARLRAKKVKGYDYWYLVEGVREGRKVREKRLDYYGRTKPTGSVAELLLAAAELPPGSTTAQKKVSATPKTPVSTTPVKAVSATAQKAVSTTLITVIEGPVLDTTYITVNELKRLAADNNMTVWDYFKKQMKILPDGYFKSHHGINKKTGEPY